MAFKIRNIATGEENPELFNFALQCIEKGEELYNAFIEETLKNMTTDFFKLVKRIKIIQTPMHSDKHTLDAKQESYDSFKIYRLCEIQAI